MGGCCVQEQAETPSVPAAPAPPLQDAPAPAACPGQSLAQGILCSPSWLRPDGGEGPSARHLQAPRLGAQAAPPFSGQAAFLHLRPGRSRGKGNLA